MTATFRFMPTTFVFTLLAVLSTGACAQWATPYTGPAYQISSTPNIAFPEVNNNVLAIVESQGVVYIGGQFTQVGGVPRSRVAALDAQTGQLLSFSVSCGIVRCMAVHNGRLFVGGTMGSAGGQPRWNLAAFDISTGQVLAWNPHLEMTPGAQNMTADDDVYCMTVSGDKLYVGGGFMAVDGTPRGGAACFDLNNLGVNNGLLAWDPNYSPTSVPSAYNLIWVRGIHVHAASDTAFITGYCGHMGGDHWFDGSPSSQPSSVRNYFFTTVSASGLGTLRTAYAPAYNNNGSPASCVTSCGDGPYAYVSGSIAQVSSGGTASNRIGLACARITGATATENVVEAFSGGLDGSSYAEALALHPSRSLLFVGGPFSMVGGLFRDYLGAIDTTTSQGNPWWPILDDQVLAICSTTTRVFVGGEFTTVGGATRRGFAAFNISWNGAAPTIAVTSGGQSVTNGGILVTPYNSTLASLQLQISVNDQGPDATALVATITGVTTQGIVTNQFSRATAAVPYMLSPPSGVFNDAAGSSHLITLEATDALGFISTFTFTINAQALVPTPMLRVLESGVPLASGAPASGARDFGVFVLGGVYLSPVTIVLDNSGGTASVTLAMPVLVGADASSFTLDTSALQITIAAGGSTSFSVQFTPGSAGIKNATITFTHSDTAVASPFSIDVTGSALDMVSISTNALPQASANLPYTATLQAIGGAAPYGWTFQSGNLPPGFVMDAHGVISGTTLALGSYTFTVRVDDSTGHSAVRTLSLTVGAADNTGSGAGGCSAAGGGQAVAALLLLLLGAAARRRKFA